MPILERSGVICFITYKLSELAAHSSEGHLVYNIPSQEH